jgi:hypothetical protein
MDGDKRFRYVFETAARLSQSKARAAVFANYGPSLEHAPTKHMCISAHLTPQQPPGSAPLLVLEAMPEG